MILEVLQYFIFICCAKQNVVTLWSLTHSSETAPFNWLNHQNFSNFSGTFYRQRVYKCSNRESAKMSFYAIIPVMTYVYVELNTNIFHYCQFSIYLPYFFDSFSSSHGKTSTEEPVITKVSLKAHLSSTNAPFRSFWWSFATTDSCSFLSNSIRLAYLLCYLKRLRLWIFQSSAQLRFSIEVRVQASEPSWRK